MPFQKAQFLKPMFPALMTIKQMSINSKKKKKKEKEKNKPTEVALCSVVPNIQPRFNS